MLGALKTPKLQEGVFVFVVAHALIVLVSFIAFIFINANMWVAWKADLFVSQYIGSGLGFFVGCLVIALEYHFWKWNIRVAQEMKGDSYWN